jgi:hypothetical protein
MSVIDMREAGLHRLGGVPARLKPTVSLERKFKFSENDIKAILARYIEVEYDIDKEIPLSDVTGDYRAASYGGPYDSSPGYCDFTVTVRG